MSDGPVSLDFIYQVMLGAGAVAAVYGGMRAVVSRATKDITGLTKTVEDKFKELTAKIDEKEKETAARFHGVDKELAVRDTTFAAHKQMHESLVSGHSNLAAEARNRLAEVEGRVKTVEQSNVETRAELKALTQTAGRIETKLDRIEMYERDRQTTRRKRTS